jgi:hypothetical protein
MVGIDAAVTAKPCAARNRRGDRGYRRRHQLATFADTMISEVFEEAHDAAGLTPAIRFFAAVIRLKLGTQQENR